MIAAALVLMAPLGVLLSQEAPKSTAPAQAPPAKKAEEPATKSAPATKPAAETAKPAAEPETAEGSKSDSSEGESADAPKRFIPSQKSSADNSATFPIDI
jgi:hypothetical protein